MDGSYASSGLESHAKRQRIGGNCSNEPSWTGGNGKERYQKVTGLGLIHEYSIILALLLFFLIHMHVYTIL